MHRPVPIENRRIYVGNLPYATTEDDLRTLFATTGQVRSVEIIKYRETGYPRGCGIVEMATLAEAMVAIDRLHKVLFHGKSLNVDQASPDGTPTPIVRS